MTNNMIILTVLFVLASSVSIDGTWSLRVSEIPQLSSLKTAIFFQFDKQATGEEQQTKGYLTITACSTMLYNYQVQDSQIYLNFISMGRSIRKCQSGQLLFIRTQLDQTFYFFIQYNVMILMSPMTVAPIKLDRPPQNSVSSINGIWLISDGVYYSKVTDHLAIVNSSQLHFCGGKRTFNYSSNVSPFINVTNKESSPCNGMISEMLNKIKIYRVDITKSPIVANFYDGSVNLILSLTYQANYYGIRPISFSQIVPNLMLIDNTQIQNDFWTLFTHPIAYDNNGIAGDLFFNDTITTENTSSLEQTNTTKSIIASTNTTTNIYSTNINTTNALFPSVITNKSKNETGSSNITKNQTVSINLNKPTSMITNQSILMINTSTVINKTQTVNNNIIANNQSKANNNSFSTNISLNSTNPVSSTSNSSTSIPSSNSVIDGTNLLSLKNDNNTLISALSTTALNQTHTIKTNASILLNQVNQNNNGQITTSPVIISPNTIPASVPLHEVSSVSQLFGIWYPYNTKQIIKLSNLSGISNYQLIINGARILLSGGCNTLFSKYIFVTGKFSNLNIVSSTNTCPNNIDPILQNIIFNPVNIYKITVFGQTPIISVVSDKDQLLLQLTPNAPTQ